MARRPRHLLLRFLRVAAALVVILAVSAALALVVLTNTVWGHEQVRRIALGLLQPSVHGVVRIGRVDGDLLTHLVLTDVSIADSSGSAFLVAHRIETGYRLGDLLRRRLYLRSVRLDSVVIVLHESPDESWNYIRVLPSLADTGHPAHPGWGSWLRLTDVLITRSDVTVRTPWHPDSLLDGAGRDSAIRVALGPDSRLAVTRVGRGYEQTTAFHEVNAAVPLADLAEPGHTTKIFRVADLATDVAAFRPPLAPVRGLGGTFHLDHDSISWSSVKALRPAMRADGWYRSRDNRLALDLRLDSASLGDLRFLDPQLPTDGRVSASTVINWRGRTQDYLARRLDVTSGPARVVGRLGVTMSDSLAFRDTDLQFSGIDAGLVSRVIPGLQIPLRGVADGRARVTGGLHALAIDADLGYESRRRGRSRILVAGRFGLPSQHGPRAIETGYRADSLRLTFAPVQLALARELIPSVRVGGDLTGRLTLDGSTTGSLSISADLVHHQHHAQSHFLADGLLKFAPGANTLSQPRASQLRTSQPPALRPTWIDFSASLEPIDSAIVAGFIPGTSYAGGANGRLEASGSLDDLTVHAQLHLGDTPDSNALAVDGSLDLASRPIGYDLTATTQRFDAHTVSSSAPHTDVTMTAKAHGRGVDLGTLATAIDADIGRSAIGQFVIDSARLRATAADGRLHVDTARMRAAATIADIRGDVGLDTLHSGTLTYRVAIDSLGAYRGFLPRDTEQVAERPEAIEAAIERARVDSAYRADSSEVERAIRGLPPPALVVDTPATLRRDMLAGRAVVTGEVQGTIRHFEVRGDLAADSVVAWGNAARHAQLRFDATVAGNRISPASAVVHLRKATISGFAMDSIAIRATYHEPDGTIRLAVYQDSLRDYVLNSQFRYTTTDREIRYDTLSFRFDSTVWSAPQGGAVAWRPDRIDVQRVELTNGRSGRILVDGTFPTASGIPADLQVMVHDLDVSDLRQILESDLPVRGRFSMQATLSGSADLPRLQGSASLLDATVRKQELPDAQVTFGYDSATLHARAQLAPAAAPAAFFADADATVPIKVVLGATGSRLLNGPLHAVVRLDSLPIDVVPEFFSSVRDIGGRVSGRVEVGGTVGRPKAQGQLAIDRGSATILATGTSVRDVVARVKVHENSLVLDSLIGRTAGSNGRLRIAGLLDRSDSAVTVVDFTMTTVDARVLDTRDLGRLNLDATLTLAGPTSSLFLYGTAKIHNAVYYLPISTGKRLVNISDPTVYVVADLTNPATRAVIPATTNILSHSRMNVDVSVEKNSWVRSPVANLEAYTVDPVVMRIDRVHRAIVVEGTVNTDRGQYTFMSKRFNVTKGLATFTGGPELDPRLQASGDYQVPVPGRQPIAIQFVIEGRADSLKLTVSSNAQPPIAQSTLLSYLAFSSPTSGISQQTESSSLTGVGNSGNVVGTASTYVQAQLASTAIGVLAAEGSGAVGRALGADVLNITTGNIYTDIGQHNEAATILQTTQIEYGKYVTTQTYVGLTVSVAPGGRVSHDIGNNLSLSASVEPLYLLGPATLSENTNTPLTGVLGLTLVKTWRF